MSRKRTAPALVILLACLPAWASAAGPDETIFCIGRNDGLAEEFGSTGPILKLGKPIVFTVGKDAPAAWPSVHPSNNDVWGGSRAHTFTIKFDAPRDYSQPLFLILGLVNSHPTEPSIITVTVNGAPLPTQRAPRGEGHSGHHGKPSTIVFRLPEGAVRRGANAVAINLAKGSWIGYDYAALRTSRRPPTRVNPLKGLLDGPLKDLSDIVFAVRVPGKDTHYYANFGYWSLDPNRKLYGDGGQLCRLDLRTGQVRVLLDDPKGGVRDPQVHYDGKRILFSYRPGGRPNYHLYEINADGTGLRQLTHGPFDDIEPTYLPDGDIAFASSRCRRWVACWYVHVATLYRCDGGGGNIRMLSSNVVTENTPAVLPDGRLLYTRWEYVDRSQMAYHHLWTMNPDGTAVMTFFGNMHPTGKRMNAKPFQNTRMCTFENVAAAEVMIDAKPIPGTNQVVAIFSPGHGRTEHAGPVVIVTPDAGPDAKGYARRISRTADFRDPYPLTPGHFLVARGRQILLMDRRGATVPVHTTRCRYRDVQCHEPVPLRPRPRERIVPSRVDPAKSTGRLILADVTIGRNMRGVKAGEVKKLLVLEQLPAPVHMSPGMDGMSHFGTFTLTRIVGTVPVEPDGSAHMELPALRSLFFVALDERDLSVKRMQSFVTLQPGETTGCTGCHEPRTRTPPVRANLLALEKPARKPTPIEGVPDVMDFPRDVQPILDRRCLACHDYDKRAGGVILTGDRGPAFSHSYFTLVALNQVADGRNAHGNRPPRTIGSSASPLMKKLDRSHYNVTLTDHERTMVRLWIDSSAPYPGTYAAMSSGRVGFEKPEKTVINRVLGRRCHACHKGAYGSPWELLHNLTRPEKSLILLAPLAKEAGGYGACKPKDAEPGTPTKPVFADTTDPAYQRYLGAIRQVKKRLETIKRFDMPGFRPNEHYIREMKRYGVLPATLSADDPVDPYAADQAYWRSLWQEPTSP